MELHRSTQEQTVIIRTTLSSSDENSVVPIPDDVDRWHPFLFPDQHMVSYEQLAG